MNKYQEALNNLVHCKSITKCKECKHKERCTMERDSDILQKLVDKETPMKVTDIHVDEFYCPKCHSEISHDKYNSEHPKYCEECGQRLDWGDSE